MSGNHIAQNGFVIPAPDSPNKSNIQYRNTSATAKIGPVKEPARVKRANGIPIKTKAKAENGIENFL